MWNILQSNYWLKQAKIRTNVLLMLFHWDMDFCPLFHFKAIHILKHSNIMKWSNNWEKKGSNRKYKTETISSDEKRIIILEMFYSWKCYNFASHFRLQFNDCTNILSHIYNSCEWIDFSDFIFLFLYTEHFYLGLLCPHKLRWYIDSWYCE